MSEWQPIETAPSNGAYVLIVGGRHAVATTAPADGEWWRSNKLLKAVPTHWMPLPAPPEQV